MALADLERFFELFNRHDLDKLMAFFAEDAVFDSPLGPPDGRRLTGRTQIRDYYERFFQDLDGVCFLEPRHWLCGERGISEWTLHAITPAGKVLGVRGCDLFGFREGLIARKDTYLKQVR